MSVRLSVCQPRLGGNVIFSASNWDIGPIFEHLSICLSVMLQSFATSGCFHPCLVLLLKRTTWPTKVKDRKALYSWDRAPLSLEIINKKSFYSFIEKLRGQLVSVVRFQNNRNTNLLIPVTLFLGRIYANQTSLSSTRG